MYIVLFDRTDRLGANITNYISQVLFAHKNNYYIYFKDNCKSSYNFSNSIFIEILFNYIEKYNNNLKMLNIEAGTLIKITEETDYLYNISLTTKTISSDHLSYFINNIFNDIHYDIKNIENKYNYIPFDVDKTILVHLRLDDTSNWKDYNGLSCSEYYKNKINNNEDCFYVSQNGNNRQAPLSKEKIVNNINRLKYYYKDYRVILLTSPNSDTSFLDYEVIKNDDENYDLYLLTICNVVLLSRSTFSLSSLFFNKNKNKRVVIPSWGHFVCFGLNTKYDKNVNFEYFY
jgi:hypothetical protein